MKTAQEITDEIFAYIQKFEDAFSNWYVGVASDPKIRLFVDHNVLYDGAWIYSPCADSEMARSIEKAFLDAGFDGGSGGGDNNTIHVYAYRKESHTNE